MQACKQATKNARSSKYSCSTQYSQTSAKTAFLVCMRALWSKLFGSQFSPDLAGRQLAVRSHTDEPEEVPRQNVRKVIEAWKS